MLNVRTALRGILVDINLTPSLVMKIFYVIVSYWDKSKLFNRKNGNVIEKRCNFTI